MIFFLVACFLVASLRADDITNDINLIANAQHRAESHPNEHQAWLDLADALEKKELFHEANRAIKKASDLQPHDIFIIHRYAISCIGIGLIDQAVEAFQSILKRAPGNNQVIYNIGYTLKMAGRVDEAIECYQKVLAVDPNYEAASFALGHALLFKGDFQNGWKQHELHLKKTNKNSEHLRKFIETNSLDGKKILLRFDGGMGDTLQFIRYAQLIKDLGATVFAAVQKPLMPLLSRCPYIDTLYAHDDTLPLAHDWAALMSLPAIFNSNEQTIPKKIPYLHPDESLIALWHDYLITDTTIKIGICWQADVFNDSSRPLVARRGIPLHEFYQLADHDQVSFYSLQQKEGLEQLTNLPDSFKLHLFDESFDVDHGSFMDTAAVMKNLDLVITVDTAIAHLAGALGTPVWLLLPYATDWRWIAGRTDTPWYPSMKIFKQSTPFDWASVMNNVHHELALFINQHNQRSSC